MCWPGVGKHHLHRSLQCEDMQCCHIHPLLHTVHIWVCCGRRCKGSITWCNVQTSRQHWWVGGPPTHVSGRFFPMLPGWRRLEDDDQALRCCLALAVNTFTWLRQLPLFLLLIFSSLFAMARLTFKAQNPLNAILMVFIVYFSLTYHWLLPSLQGLGLTASEFGVPVPEPL